MSKTKLKDTATPVLPPLVLATASVHSIGGVSVFQHRGYITSQNVGAFYGNDYLTQIAVQKLQAAGFQILAVNPIGISIAAPPETYEKAFKTKIVAEERPVIKEMGEQDTATFIECPETPLAGLIDTSKTDFADCLEGVAINDPVYFMSFPTAFAPTKTYWHLDVPAGVSLGLNADRAHRMGVTGKGINVAMVDSGWYKHPFFSQRGYKAMPPILGPSAANPLADESGHGTGESANIFSAAPDVSFRMVKMSFVDSLGAFNAAVAMSPHIITCSWGSDKRTAASLSAADLMLAVAISNAVRSGIVVIFSAGNGHYGFPGQHPDVISAGGTFMSPDGSLRASDYASGFISPNYPNRRCPDVCGLVGMKPKAAYIMLPIEPNDAIDIDLSSAGALHPNGDETAPNDGWAAFSGTSAAAPQLAGVCALIKQIRPALTPSQIREILKRTARDVTTGNCNTASTGAAATVGNDLATGAGLVDAFAAVRAAMAF
jgi:subtilase family serine protease